MHDISKLKDHFKENKLFFNRAVAATVITLVIFLILISRICYLQVVKHDLYSTLAKNNQVRIIPLPPTRGLIFDRNGTLLTENIPTFSLTIVPNLVKNLKDTIKNLREVIPLSQHDINNFYKQIKYKGIYEEISIKTKLSEKEVAKFSLEKYHYPGVDISASLARNYIFKEILSHTVGYIGPISDTDLQTIDISKYRGVHQIGKIGVEKYYEEDLKGKLGYQHVETNSKGRVLRILAEDQAIPGKDIHLSIDINLQKLIYKQLGNKRGAFVALDPNTGEVLAIASTPGFDPNLFIQGITTNAYNSLRKDKNKPLFNRAIKGKYPPGSTVKPIIALTALEEGIISDKSIIHDPGYFQINKNSRKFRCWKSGGRGHGSMKIENAIGESCGTFFYSLANTLGIDKLHKTFTKFNLGKKTNIDIYGEETGLAPSASWKKKTKKMEWFPGETLNVGIGQGFTLATPIQLAVMTSAIANRGEIIQPHVVLKSTSTVKRQKVAINNSVNWNTIIKGMEKTIKHRRGTAYKYFKGFPFRAAGKTGTAQVFSLGKDKIYDEDSIAKHLRDHSWFIAFAPINKPKIAIAAIIENDKGAPKLVRDIMEYYLLNSKS